jgi:hypothetical protein
MEVVVALLALLTLANIGLTVAVIRRLAAHERKLAEFTSWTPPAGLAPGDAVPDFLAETHTGERIDESFLAEGQTSVAFFSATCDACALHAPEFAAVRGPKLAVLTGEGPTGATILAALADVPVVREANVGGPIAQSFQVDTFPTYFAVEHGHVMAAVGSTDELGDLLAR